MFEKDTYQYRNFQSVGRRGRVEYILEYILFFQKSQEFSSGFFNLNDKTPKIEKITPARIMLEKLDSTKLAIFFEKSSRIKIVRKLEIETATEKIAVAKLEIMPTAHFSCFPPFGKTKNAGAKIKTKPTIPESVSRGIFKLNSTKKLVASVFQKRSREIPAKIAKLKSPNFRRERIKKIAKIARKIITTIIRLY